MLFRGGGENQSEVSFLNLKQATPASKSPGQATAPVQRLELAKQKIDEPTIEYASRRQILDQHNGRSP